MIDSYGNYTILSTTNTTQNGTYSIAISTLHINGVSAINLLATTTLFKLTVTNPSCANTQITGPDSISNLVAFAGYTTTTDQSYTFNDTYSELYTTQGASSDYCGNKIFSFSIRSLSQTLLFGDNTGFITFSTTSNTTHYSNYSANLSVCVVSSTLVCKII